MGRTNFGAPFLRQEERAVSDIGPVEYMVVGFPGNQFKGEIIPALGELVDSGVMRIIDLAFVAKDQEGNVIAMEMEDVDSEIGKAFQKIQSRVGDLISEADLSEIGDSLEPNTSAAVLVWEDAWAAKFVTALRNANGQLIDIERVPRDVVEAAVAYAEAS